MNWPVRPSYRITFEAKVPALSRLETYRLPSAPMGKPWGWKKQPDGALHGVVGQELAGRAVILQDRVGPLARHVEVAVGAERHPGRGDQRPGGERLVEGPLGEVVGEDLARVGAGDEELAALRID